jgi:predicted transcriptional regulator
MKRTTVFLDERIESDLRSIARRQKRPVAAVLREALEKYVSGEKRRPGLPRGLVSLGRSGRRDTAERHEELLWSDLGPRRNRRKKNG